MGNLRRMSDLLEFQVTPEMMAAAGSSRPGGIAGRVQNLERAYANLEAADPKRAKAARKLIDAVEKAVAQAEAHMGENAAPKIRLNFVDGMGNKDTVIVDGTDVWAYDGNGKSGTSLSLSNFMFMSAKGYADSAKAFRDALLLAYKRSGGKAQAVLDAAREVTQLPGPRNWYSAGEVP